MQKAYAIILNTSTILSLQVYHSNNSPKILISQIEISDFRIESLELKKNIFQDWLEYQ